MSFLLNQVDIHLLPQLAGIVESYSITTENCCVQGNIITIRRRGAPDTIYETDLTGLTYFETAGNYLVFVRDLLDENDIPITLIKTMSYDGKTFEMILPQTRFVYVTSNFIVIDENYYTLDLLPLEDFPIKFFSVDERGVVYAGDVRTGIVAPVESILEASNGIFVILQDSGITMLKRNGDYAYLLVTPDPEGDYNGFINDMQFVSVKVLDEFIVVKRLKNGKANMRVDMYKYGKDTFKPFNSFTSVNAFVSDSKVVKNTYEEIYDIANEMNGYEMPAIATVETYSMPEMEPISTERHDIISAFDDDREEVPIGFVY